MTHNCYSNFASLDSIFLLVQSLAKIPFHEQVIMLSDNVPRERLDHVFSKPKPQAANVKKMCGLVIIQLRCFLQGHRRWHKKVKFFENISEIDFVSIEYILKRK